MDSIPLTQNENVERVEARHPLGPAADLGHTTAWLTISPTRASTGLIPIKLILDHLGLSPPGQEQPAPTPEVVRAPVDDEGREILAG